MPPKKKAPEVTGPSTSNPSPLEQAGGGEDAGGGTGVVKPVLGPAASELAPRPSQEARNQQRPGTHGTIRSLDQTELGGPKALRASMHTSVPERAWHGCLDRVLLLLTWLGVRAHPAPCAIRHLCPPPQRKLSHELSYS